MQRLVQGLAFFLLCLSASAADPSDFHCENPSVLRARVKSCEENLQYASAGKKCLARYEAVIEAARAQVAKTLQAMASSDQQSAGLENAKQSYQMAISSLRALERKGNVLQIQVASYKNEVVLPDDFGSVTEAGLPAETFLEGQSCYRETQKLIKQYSELIALSAKQLSVTAQITEELAKRAYKGEASLKNKDLLPLLKTGAQEAEKIPPKKKTGKSDITGTESKKKKP